MIWSRYGRDCSRVAIAESADMSRRKHMMSWTRRPSWACASSRARYSPPMTVSNAIPRLVCAWGSKKTSA